MKIAYVGIDLLKCVLDTVLDSGCEVIKLFTCHTDNVTEFNTGVIDSARRAGIPYSSTESSVGIWTIWPVRDASCCCARAITTDCR